MHHNDAPDLDPRTDITDLFAFQKPGDPTRSIFIINVHPDASALAAFDPDNLADFPYLGPPHPVEVS